MKTSDVHLLDRAAAQHGLVTRADARSLELTDRQLRSRVAGGVLVPVHPDVYRHAAVPPTREQAVMAACLAAPGAVASRRCAAALWGMRGFDLGIVEITVPGRRRPELLDVIAHTTNRLDRIDV